MRRDWGKAYAVGVVSVTTVAACSVFADLDGYVGDGEAADATTGSPYPGVVPGTDAQVRCGLADPIYLVRAPTNNDRFYTPSLDEVSQLIAKAGYTDNRGIAFYGSATPDSGLVPAYRLNKPGFFTTTHLWTANEAEKQRAMQGGVPLLAGIRERRRVDGYAAARFASTVVG